MIRHMCSSFNPRLSAAVIKVKCTYVVHINSCVPHENGYLAFVSHLTLQRKSRQAKGLPVRNLYSATLNIVHQWPWSTKGFYVHFSPEIHNAEDNMKFFTFRHSQSRRRRAVWCWYSYSNNILHVLNIVRSMNNEQWRYFISLLKVLQATVDMVLIYYIYSGIHIQIRERIQ